MKKALFIAFILMTVLPAFGQKLNSRGEKMVKSITEVGKHRVYYRNYTFTYDAKGDMKTAMVLQGTLFCNDKFWLIKKSNNVLTLTTNQKCFFYDSPNYSDPVIHILTLDTNSDGLISKIIFPVTDNFDNIYWTHYDYEYGRSSDGHYMLLKSCESTWIHDKGKKPQIEPEHMYNCTLHSYADGGHHYEKMYTKSIKGEELDSRNGFDYTYDGIKNDTNISLLSLFLGEYSLLPELVGLTEWSPFYSPLLPSTFGCAEWGSIFYDFKYYYDDGNLVRIERCSHETGRIEDAYDITYVEEWQ